MENTLIWHKYVEYSDHKFYKSKNYHDHYLHSDEMIMRNKLVLYKVTEVTPFLVPDHPKNQVVPNKVLRGIRNGP